MGYTHEYVVNAYCDETQWKDLHDYNSTLGDIRGDQRGMLQKSKKQGGKFTCDMCCSKFVNKKPSRK